MDSEDEAHDRLLQSIDSFAVKSVKENGKEKKRKKSLSKENNSKSWQSANDAENDFAPASSSLQGLAKLSQPSSESFSSSRGENGEKGEATLEDLLGSLGESAHARALRGSLAELGRGGAEAPKSVPRVVSARLERKAVYESAQRALGKWQPLVAQNRQARTLDLARDARSLADTRASHKKLLGQFAPASALERDVRMVLLDSRTADAPAAQEEADELRARSLSPQELREKQAAMAKIKALMFYEQIKRHRLNKIKSKKYHKIRKNQKLKGVRSGGEDGEEEDEGEKEGEAAEKQAYLRIKERMDLKHKNTGKWAKMAKKYSRMDAGLRNAYHESVLLGQELSKKIEVNDMSDEALYDEQNMKNDNDDDEEEDEVEVQRKIARREKINEKISRDLEATSKYNKLFQMSFMKKASQNLQDNLDEAERQKKEEEEWERKMIEEEDDDDERITSNNDVKNTIPDKKNENSNENRDGVAMINLNNQAVLNPPNSSAVNLDFSSNPWLLPSSNSVGGKKRKAAVILEASNLKTDLEVLKTENKNKKEISVTENNETTSNEVKKTVKPLKKGEKIVLLNTSQEKLVQTAFSGPDYDEDFAKHREALEAEKNSKNKKPVVKSGWGDWNGPMTDELQRKKQKKQLEKEKMEKCFKRTNEKASSSSSDKIKNFNVILSEDRIATQAKYKLSKVPFPFTSVAQYEKSIERPLGGLWNSSTVVKENTRPEVLTRAGRIIEPISLKNN